MRIHDEVLRVIGTKSRERTGHVKTKPCFIAKEILHVFLKFPVKFPDVHPDRACPLTGATGYASAGKMIGSHEVKDHGVRCIG